MIVKTKFTATNFKFISQHFHRQIRTLQTFQNPFFFIKQKKFNLFPFYLQHFNTFIIRLPPYKLWQGKTHEKLWQGKAHEELWQGHRLWQG